MSATPKNDPHASTGSKALVQKLLGHAAAMAECLIAVVVVVALVLSFVPFLRLLPELATAHDPEMLLEFLEYALNLVIGVEFIKMLIRHNPGSVLEVLLFAFARHLVLGSSSAQAQLLGVLSLAALFAIRRFLFVSDFEDAAHDEPAPEPEQPEKEPAEAGV